MIYPTTHQFIYLSNKGAHFATQAENSSLECKALQLLLTCSTTPKLIEFLLLLKTLGRKKPFELALKLIHHEYIVATNNSESIQPEYFEANLKSVLPELSGSQHCAISDEEGFLLAYTGFELEQAEQATLLAIEISGLQSKRQHNIKNLSGNNRAFISIIDNDGQSQLRFWPMHFNNQVFYLAIKGTPLLEQLSFTHLTWLLGQRYL